MTKEPGFQSLPFLAISPNLNKLITALCTLRLCVARKHCAAACGANATAHVAVCVGNILLQPHILLIFTSDSLERTFLAGGEDTEKVLSSAKVFVVREFCATGNLTVGREYYIFGKDGEFVDTNADTM